MRTPRKRISAIAAGIGSSVFLSGAVIAAEPNPIAAGDMQFTAMFDFGLERDGNVYRSDTDKTESAVVTLAPKLQLMQENATGSVSFNYDGYYAHYHEDQADSYENHTLSAAYDRSNENNRFGASAEFAKLNEPRGTGSSEGAANTNLVDGPTGYDQNDLEVYIGFGNEDSVSDFQLTLGYSDIEFDDFEFINAGRDRDVTTLGATYKYRYSAATSLFIDASRQTLEYSDLLQGFAFQLDGDQTKVHGGVEWSINELIIGTVGVGYTRKELDDSPEDYKGSSWELAIEWTPTERDTVLFVGGKKPNESQGSGAFQITTDMAMS